MNYICSCPIGSIRAQEQNLGPQTPRLGLDTSSQGGREQPYRMISKNEQLPGFCLFVRSSLTLKVALKDPILPAGYSMY